MSVILLALVLHVEGRREEGSNDFKRWKANFRCALNILPDVVEERSLRSSKGKEPYKVYRLLKSVVKSSALLGELCFNLCIPLYPAESLKAVASRYCIFCNRQILLVHLIMANFGFAEFCKGTRSHAH